MASAAPRTLPLYEILAEDLRRAAWLTPAEAAGGWRTLAPELAGCLPAPYPVFAEDEEQLLGRGFPVLHGAAAREQHAELERLLAGELEYRAAVARAGEPDKTRVLALRERYQRGLAARLVNAALSDYGRSIVEVLLLRHIGEVAAVLGRNGSLPVHGSGLAGRDLETARWSLARLLADLLQRAWLQAVDTMRTRGDLDVPATSPLLAAVAADPVVLGEGRPAPELAELGGYLRTVLRLEPEVVAALRERVVRQLEALRGAEPTLYRALAVTSGLDLEHRHAAFQPSLWTAAAALQLQSRLGVEAEGAASLADLGARMKRYEVVSALARRVLPVVEEDGVLRLAGGRREALAASSRPFDFTRPGVVDLSVRRFGLIYDLTSFTAMLEEVRKQGPRTEERALHAMYVFQRRLETIRQRYRLVFEKFLGDGAFYSSRRALPVLEAACRMQVLYDDLCHRGFPFDRGMRMALNVATYRLLPLAAAGGGSRFEFFGHGVVELARLTTGKSTREVAEIGEMLVNAGYEPGHVEAFLRPLLQVRGGGASAPQRPFAACIDERGELINEGIVLTIPFLTELERDLEGGFGTCDAWGERWIVLSLPGFEPAIGLRFLGVGRLKGLAPMELCEAVVLPPGTESEPAEELPLLVLLRQPTATASERLLAPEELLGPDLAVVTYLDDHGTRRWIFGSYEEHHDALQRAVEVPIRPPDLRHGEPLEVWLFRNRYDLARLYGGLVRDGGSRCDLAPLREHDGYLACFLAAPHRAPR